MKKKSKKQRKMNRTRKKKGAQHSTLAKQAMIKSAENQQKKFLREFNEKVKNLDKLDPSQLLQRRRPIRIDPNQLERGNLPYPNIGGGKRHNRKRRTRKRKSRRKKKRRRTKKK